MEYERRGKIEYRGGFVYRIVFDDGKSDDIDFSEYGCQKDVAADAQAPG